MANHNITPALAIPEPIDPPAPQGKLRMLGTTIGFSTPIQIDAVNERGELIALGLADILQRLDDFTNERGHQQTVKKRIIECLFIAYRYEYTMTGDERPIFETWVRDRVRGVEAIEAAKAVLLNS
ncbi:Uncharacterised protein [Bordetella hinzii]|uniref:hypothetical protein n=1 Tax=Bordetella hinzii TaxID=103855 RepID=UPI000671C120|nr:hypothetical protein [Bordetella hinzii]AKQ56397.1 hypothetical protein ACR54_03095 [Bordetella hinzii]SNV74868.1 Uncharacterised protein [Bordetella hinzii]